MNIIESKRLVSVSTEEDHRLKDIKLYWSKPSNFVKMIKCEDDDKNEIKYIELENEIEFHVNKIEPVTIYYEVNKSEIFDQLKEICS